MTQLPGPEAVQADFKNVILTNETTRYTLLDSDGFYRVRMESLSQNAETAPRAAEVPIGLVTGSHNMQVF